MASLDVRRLVRRLGFDVSRWPHAQTLSGHLRRVLGALDVSVVLDVGANHGQFARRLRHDVRYRGRICSFEPAASAFHTLAEAARADEHWIVEHLAVGDATGTSELRCFAESDWNSLHAIDAAALGRSGRTVTPLGTELVDVVRLDAVWERCIGPDDKPFLKSDTQGHELAVLRGAGDHIAKVDGLLLEVSIRTMYEDEPDIGEVIDATRELGFRPSGFFPVTRTKHSLALETVDICFVRDRDRG